MPPDGDAPWTAGSPVQSEPLPVTLRVGLGLYILSFLLPAAAGVTGIQCALLAFLVPILNFGPGYRLALFGGLINPMMLAYFYARRHSLKALRIRLAVAIVVCIPLTWVSLAYMGQPVWIGHYIWIAGILLILWPVHGRLPTRGDLIWGAAGAMFAIGIWWSIRMTLDMRLEPATDRDQFFYDVGTGLGSPGVCAKISLYAGGMGTPLSEGLVNRPTRLRDDCYKDLSADSYSLSADYHEHAFVHFMQATGYDDKRVAAFICRARGCGSAPTEYKPSSADYLDYFHTMSDRENRAEREEFLDRVMALK